MLHIIESLLRFLDGTMNDVLSVLPNLRDDDIVLTMTLAEVRMLSEKLHEVVDKVSSIKKELGLKNDEA